MEGGFISDLRHAKVKSHFDSNQALSWIKVRVFIQMAVTIFTKLRKIAIPPTELPVWHLQSSVCPQAWATRPIIAAVARPTMPAG
jgi:hypothetical protein